MLQEQYFTKINEEVLTLVLQRCEGNPLISLNFLFNLLAVSQTLSHPSRATIWSKRGALWTPQRNS